MEVVPGTADDVDVPLFGDGFGRAGENAFEAIFTKAFCHPLSGSERGIREDRNEAHPRTKFGSEETSIDPDSAEAGLEGRVAVR